MKVSIEEQDGKPHDCSILLSKGGSCGASQVEAISRMIALLFKYGVGIELIIKHLKGIRCNFPYIREDEENLSCADAIAKALEEFVKKES